MTAIFGNNIFTDKTRFLMESMKLGNETILKNISTSFFKDYLEIHVNKGLIPFISPCISGLLVILLKNSQDFFFSLSKTFFIKQNNKKQIIEHLVLVGIAFYKHSHFVNFTGVNLSIFKNKKLSKILYNLNSVYTHDIDLKNCLPLPDIKSGFIDFCKFVLLETTFLFFKNNPFVSVWRIKLVNMFLNDRNFKEKKYLMALQEFIKTLNLNLILKIYPSRKKEKEPKKFQTWESDLYENCIHQMVFIKNTFSTLKKVEKNLIRKFFGSNIYYCNFKINYTGIEKTTKNAQKHFIPIYSLTIKSIEKKFCNIEQKKNCLEAYLDDWQYFLLSKIEILTKRFRGFYLKFFFKFNWLLPESFLFPDREFSVVETGNSFKKFLNHFISKNCSSSFFLLFENLLTYYFKKTHENFLFHFSYLMFRKSIDSSSKLSIFFFFIKFFKMKKGLNKIFGGILEHFIYNYTKNRKMDNLKKLYSYLPVPCKTHCFNGLRLQLSRFYFQFGLKKKAYNLIKKNLFLSIYLRIILISKNEKSIKLLLRKYSNQSIRKKRSIFTIFFAKLNRNIKYYQIGFELYPKLTALMKYSISVALIEEKKYVNSKKQALISISADSNNKQAWFVLRFLLSLNKNCFIEIKSLYRILKEEPNNIMVKINQEEHIAYLIRRNQFYLIDLAVILKNIEISDFLLLRIFKFLTSKNIKNPYLFNFTLFLFDFKKIKTTRNFIFIRCILFLFIDLVQRNPKIFFNKKNLFHLIIKTLTFKCPFYLKFWFQTIFKWRLFSYIFGNIIFNLNSIISSSFLFKKKVFSINIISEKTEKFFSNLDPYFVKKII